MQRTLLSLSFGLCLACNHDPRSAGAPRSPAASAASVPAQSGTQGNVPGATSSSTPAPAPPVSDRPLPVLHAGGARVVAGRSGVVASVEDNATRAGVEILERGGNAADAAVAVAFALAVTHPSAGNLGGGGFLLYRPRGGPTQVVEFRERAPLSVTQHHFEEMLKAGAKGAAAAAVPGTVAGLDLALERFGKLPRPVVMEPAIRLARDGFPLGQWQARTIAWAFADLSRDAAARAVFGAGGAPRRAGGRLVQTELARTLGRIAELGDAGFYDGETAAAITALASRGGIIRSDDLSSYRAVVREPLSVDFHGLTVDLPPPPSAGGVAVAILLRTLEHLSAERFAPLSPEACHLFAEVARRAHAIRRLEVRDPDFPPAVDWTTRTSHWLAPDELLARFPPVDPEHRTPSRDVSPLYDAAMRELEHTTHLSVVDRDGNAASLTTTLSASFGARIMAAGVVMNNALSGFGTVGENVLGPGKRMTTSMSPALVLARGETVLVTGSPGGDTIPNTVVQVIRNVVDHGMTIDDAVDAPRIHQGFVPDEIRYESQHPPPRATLAALRRRGHRLSSPSRAMGGANSILVADGVAYGHADPREGGSARAVR